MRHVAGEVRIGHGLRHDRVERSADRFVLDGPQGEACDVVDMNARHPLPTAAESSAQAGPEYGENQLHSSPLAPENKTGAEKNDARIAHFFRLPFPGAADIGQKPGSGRRTLVNLAISRVAVKSDG